MRAKEFVLEDVNVHTGVKMRRSAEHAMPGVHRVSGTADRLYDLNRVMMMVACADGITQPDLPQESWAGRNNTAHPYTREEADMLKHAYAAANVAWDDVLKPNPDNKSRENPAVYKISPVAQGAKFGQSKKS